MIEETWNLTDLYGTPEDWEGDTGRIKEKMGAVSAYRGRLG
ncbi:MAG TPA: hypothetical protein VNL71_01285 [Chloroflexota bacterium]|nr:hypothetical protein [Chloroflexota bacterium]HVC81685.1 hypothetical protein [Chloroflexota bacterium]